MSTPSEALNKTMTLPSGGAAYVTATDGHKTTISSPEPSPPGSVVRARVEGLGTEFQLKVRNCYRSGEAFVIEGRMQNATREMKAWLVGVSPEA
jgi:hypothetical protein